MGDMPLMTSKATFSSTAPPSESVIRLADAHVRRASSSTTTRASRTRRASFCLLPASFHIALLARHRVRFKDIVHARIDRRRKIPATSLLMAWGMDPEGILSTFYLREDRLQRECDHWAASLSLAEAYRGMKAVVDLIDADTGELVSKGPGRKIKAERASSWPRRVEGDSRHRGRSPRCYIAEDVVHPATGEIYARRPVTA